MCHIVFSRHIQHALTKYFDVLSRLKRDIFLLKHPSLVAATEIFYTTNLSVLRKHSKKVFEHNCVLGKTDLALQ